MNEMVIDPPRPTGWGRIRRFLALLVPGIDDIRRHEPVFPPLVAGWVFSVVAAVASRPLLLRALGGEQPGASSTVQLVLVFAALIAPLLMLLKALLLTAVGWAVLTLGGVESRIRPLFSVLLYGEAILMFQGVAVVLLVHLTTGGVVSSPQDLQLPLGLGAIVPPTMPVLWAVAQSVTLFHLAWFLFLTAAFRHCFGFSRARAVGLACLMWAAVLAFAAVRAQVTL